VKKEKVTVQFEIFGTLACFTNSQFKLDRSTYDIPTCSAIRGVCCAIYCKPIEFYYQVRKIEVLNEIKHINIMTNELKDGRISENVKKINPICRENFKTQKRNTFLKDVHYRITVDIIKQPDWDGDIEAIKAQFYRRLNGGKCFKQPYLGTRECVCYFEPVDNSKKPISLSKDFGKVLYDIFDIRNNTPLMPKKNENEVIRFTYFDAKMVNGVIEIPEYEEILGKE
jgi:CRISPR-associated protein Cas5d